MRMMRELSWRHFIFGVITVAAAFATIRIAVKSSRRSSMAEVAVVKPSSFHVPTPIKSTPPKRIEVVANDDAAEDGFEGGAMAPRPTEPSLYVSMERIGTPDPIPGPGEDCGPVEFRGGGMQRSKLTNDEWANIMEQFHGVKKDLLAWLKKNRKGLDERTALAMEEQIRELRIQRAPTGDEPDLAWRGIGILAQDMNEKPLIRLGGGFIHLFRSHLSRARFELTRLVAQAWAPCELNQMSAGEVWSPLLACLEVKEQNACGEATYSEAGWAVSSTIAAAVAPPGCTLPVFKNDKYAECLKTIPLAKETAKWSPARPGVRMVQVGGNNR